MAQTRGTRNPFMSEPTFGGRMFARCDDDCHVMSLSVSLSCHLQGVDMYCEFESLTVNQRRWTLGAVMVACAAVFPACAALDDGNDPSAETARATSGLAAAEPDALDADFLETPGGRIHRSCIHDIGDGA